MQNQIVVNNNLISYLHLANNNSHQTLFFLHGWRSRKEVWNQIVSSIKYAPYAEASEDKQVSSIYAIDLPGFGLSPAPKEAWSVGDYAGLVKNFIEKLELKNVILVGHSFGGRIGIKLCVAQNRSIPHNSPLPSFILREGTIKKLVLVDSAGFAVSSNKKFIMATATKILKPLFKPKFMQGLRKKIYQQIGSEDYLATPELQQTFVNVIEEDLTEDMKRIAVPTLMIWGENDTETPLDHLYKMKSLIPNTKYQILKNAGHFSFLDQPQEFVKILNEFI